MTAHEQLIRCALAEIRPQDCRSQLNVPAAVGRRNQAEDVDHERLHFAGFRVGSVVSAGSDSPVVCHVGLKVAHASRRRSIAVCLEASHYIFIAASVAIAISLTSAEPFHLNWNPFEANSPLTGYVITGFSEAVTAAPSNTALYSLP